MKCDMTDVPSTSTPPMTSDQSKIDQRVSNCENGREKNESETIDFTESRPIRRPRRAAPNSIGLRLLLMTVSMAVLLQSVFSLTDTVHDARVRKLIYKHLGRVPHPNVRVPHPSEVPHYFWDFYEDSNTGSDAASAFDIVRHYLPRGVHPDVDRDGNGWRIVWNLTSSGRLPEKELVLKADFRLLFAPKNHDTVIDNDVEIDDDVESDGTGQTINVYEIDPVLPDVRRLLDSRHVSNDAMQNGIKWIDFDVTSVLNRRRRDEENDLIELYIEHISDLDIPFVDLTQSAALITQIEHLDNTHRRKRSTNRHHSRRQRGYHVTEHASNVCHREDLYVNFNDIHWNDVVAPKEFNAFQCRGLCNQATPTAYQNYSNHAIIQNLLHQIDEKQVPMPCCVPTELDALSMLYRDEMNNTVLRKYEQMIVTACGCL